MRGVSTILVVVTMCLLASACGAGGEEEGGASTDTDAGMTSPVEETDPAATDASADADAGAGELAPVTMAYVPIVALAPMYIAQEKGFFGDYGVEVELTTTANPYDLLAVQSQGDLDVNLVGTSAAYFNAVNQGLGVRAVSDRMQYRCSSDNMLLVRKELWDEGVQEFADLEGRTIAIIARGSGTEYWLDLLLSENGMTQEDINIVTLSYPDLGNALQTGAVDAGFQVQPIAYSNLSDGVAERIVGMHEVLPGQQLGEWIFSTDFIERDGGAPAAGWLAAWIEGVRYYLDEANRDEVIQIISDWTEVDVEVVSALYGTDQWPWMDPNARLDTEYIEENDAQWMLDNELIETLPPTDGYYESGPLDAALEMVGEVEFERDCADVPRLENVGG